MRRPGNPRFSGDTIGFRMTASKLIAGVLRIWILVIVAVNATAGDGDLVPRAPGPSASVTAASPVSESSQAPTNDEVIINFLMGRFQKAATAFADGNYEKSWRICEAILVLAPESFESRFEVSKLRRRAHGRFLSRSALVVRFEQDQVEERLPFPLALLQGSVVLENLSQQKIVFGQLDQEPVIGQLFWAVKEVFEDGTERSTSDVRVLRIESGFSIEAGGSRAIPVTLPLSVPARMPVLQQWAVTGVTMPVRIVTADGEVTRGVPWLEETGLAVPKGYDQAIREPATEMKKALLEGDLTRFSICRYLWLADRLKRGVSATPSHPIVDELLGFLGSHGAILDIQIVMTLEQVTGLIRERSARAWKIWGVTRQVRREADAGRD